MVQLTKGLLLSLAGAASASPLLETQPTNNLPQPQISYKNSVITMTRSPRPSHRYPTTNQPTTGRIRSASQNIATENEYSSALTNNFNNTVTLTLFRDGADGNNQDPKCQKSNIPDSRYRFHLRSAFDANGETPIENEDVAKLFSKEIHKSEVDGRERHVQIFLYFCDDHLPGQLRIGGYSKLANRFDHEAKLVENGDLKVRASVKILDWDMPGVSYWKDFREEQLSGEV